MIYFMISSTSRATASRNSRQLINSDQLIFTNKRIVSIDIQGLTGTRKSYSTLPYSKIQFFTIQTPGLAEVVPDSELFIMFTNGFTATFEFKGDVNIGAIGKMLSNYVLNQGDV